MPTLDATSQLIDQSGASGSVSHTCTGSDLLLVSCLGWRSATATVTGVTYNSVAMTGLTMVDQAGIRSQIWYLAGPATGPNTIAWTMSEAPAQWDAYAVSYTAVDQTTPVGTQGTGTGSGTAQSATVTSATDEVVIGIASVRLGGTVTEDASQTSRGSSPTGGVTTNCSDEPGAASTTHSYTSVNSDNWSCVGVGIKPVAAAAAQPYQPWMQRGPVVAQ